MWRVSRCIGHRDYDRAIRTLERELLRDPTDPLYLNLISQCHRLADREEDAIAFARRALESEPSSFDAMKILAEIYARRAEHDLAAEYCQFGLEHFPEPLPITPKAVFGFLRVLSFILPGYKALEEKARQEISDPNRSNNEWRIWAKEYLRWLDERDLTAKD